jgi:DNA-binding LacI/PurR family transcriptional regulator
MPTLDDVARRAGVSRVTASRVLNGTYQNKVSESTRQRVREAVAELNYITNVPARALRSKRTMQFGLLIPDLAFSFMPEVVQGLQDVASQMDYGCLIYLTHNQPQLEEHTLGTLIGRRVDGLIWMPTAQPTERTRTLQGTLPTVTILMSTEGLSVPSVLIDQEEGGYVAAKHLLELGHRHISYMYVDHRHWRQRKVGYQRALAEYGIVDDPSCYTQVPNLDWQESLLVARNLLNAPNRPTAIIAASDVVALAVLRAARELDLNVPQDLSVVGFGNSSFSHQIELPLTTVDHPKRIVGQVAMRSLAELLSGNSIENSVLPVTLVERLSSGPPRTLKET